MQTCFEIYAGMYWQYIPACFGGTCRDVLGVDGGDVEGSNVALLNDLLFLNFILFCRLISVFLILPCNLPWSMISKEEETLDQN